MTNDSGTSVSEAAIISDSSATSKDPAVGVLALGHEAASSQGTPTADEDAEEGEIDEDEDTSMKSRSPSAAQVSQQEASRNLAPGRFRTSKLSAEDLNGGLLDGTLDDEDEDMDGDTEDTEPAPGTHATDREVEEEEEGEIDEDQEEEDEEEEDDDKPADTDDDTHLKVPKGPNAHGTASPAASEDQDDGSNIGDADGDVAMTEQEGDENEDDEDEGTPAGQTDDEGSELHEEDGSQVEDGDEDGDGDGDGDEDEEEEDDDDDAPATPKKDVASFSHKPTLNRPQLIAEDLKDSGDDLSDLSEFDDTDDSDDEEVGRSSKSKGSSSGAAGSAAASTASASAAATAASASALTANSRPSLGGRKRSLREASRETKEQEEKVKDELEEDEETNAPQSDKETESEIAEEEANEEKGEGEEDGEEEEDLEKKQVYTEALEALSSIEVEFAHLRDKMYEERMLELETEVEMINDATHPELSTLMKEIEDKRDQRLRVARAWRTHMNEISQAEFEIKEYQAHCTYQSKKREMRTDLTNGVGQKQQQLRLELTLAENRARRQPIEKSVMVRARKHTRAKVSELRAVNERYGFPVSNDLRMIATAELDEDFAAMGIPRPVPQTNVFTDHGQGQAHGHGHGHSQGLAHGQVVPQSRMHERPPGYGPHPPQSVPMGGNMSTSRPGSHHWGGSIEHNSLTGMRPEVEIYEDGNRCKVDGIWYKPNDLVVVLDAALGQYHAKYLFLANDEIMLQKTDGTKTRLHLNLFRGRKLYMQPRP
ncbi:MAG: Sds3-like-domain-containing protein [Linnemannia gamsii]|nr:MAG: Sds3-like-domain-containing protein [Linnemannia gamsii]